MPYVALAALLIALALPASAPARTVPAQAQPCAKQAKKVTQFKKGMPARQRRFFRSHGSKKQRRAFVRKQKAKLKKLRRAHARCLSGGNPPGPGPAPGPGPGPPDPGPVPTESLPGGLTGESGAPALDAVQDVFASGASVADSEVTGSVVRTQVELVFEKDATIAQVNDVLRRHGATIVSSREGVLIAVVRIADPGSVDALESKLAALEAEPALRRAGEVFMPAPDEVPEHVIFGTPDIALLRSQLAARAHAAWNARAALAGRTPPTLVVQDYFGDGPPGPGYDITEVVSDFDNGAGTHDHGYMVLGITSGAYDAVGSGSFAAEAVTGMYPGTLSVRAADILSGLAGAVAENRMLDLIENAPGDVVVNTSLGGWPCSTPAEAAAYCNVQYATEKALTWIEKVRGTDPSRPGSNLESRFVHATSAGNIEDAVGPVNAEVNSEWAAAALLPLGTPNLSNTMVVENATVPAAEPFRPGCLAASSEVGGTIAGIGAPVHSFESPTAAETLSDGGTSAATPQLAGLAAYVWTLRPSMSSSQVVGLIERAERTDTCVATVDAYAAVLAADAGNPAQPVRKAIVDVADAAGQPGADGQFDENDVDEFLAGLFDFSGLIDYGRFDLNGDGVTRTDPGFDRRDRVDLDADEDHDGAELDLDGLTVHFDERSLSDDNVLCYLAYSPLWQGTAEARTERLGADGCLNFELSHTFPSQVREEENTLLTIAAEALEIRDTDGNPIGLEGVHLELTPTGGVVGDTSGATDENGLFTTNARLSDGQGQLTIDVEAFDAPGGRLLGEDTVVATQLADGTFEISGFFAHLAIRAGAPGSGTDDDQEASSGDWSMNGSTASGGGSASAGGSATLEPEGDGVSYTGTVHLEASASGQGSGSAGVDHTVDLEVSGGPVRWQVTQRVEGLFPPGPFLGGCQVNGRSAFGGGGTMEPGSNQITFDCGGGTIDPDFPQMDADIEFTMRIGF